MSFLFTRDSSLNNVHYDCGRFIRLVVISVEIFYESEYLRTWTSIPSYLNTRRKLMPMYINVADLIPMATFFLSKYDKILLKNVSLIRTQKLNIWFLNHFVHYYIEKYLLCVLYPQELYMSCEPVSYLQVGVI